MLTQACVWQRTCCRPMASTALLHLQNDIATARRRLQDHETPYVCRRTCYRPMMTILASRERFCLHPDIATAPNKTEACEGATMVGHMDCSYLENAEASWYPQVCLTWACTVRHLTHSQASHAQNCVAQRGHNQSCAVCTSAHVCSDMTLLYVSVQMCTAWAQ